MVLKVLVACEYSGVVRDAFLRAGHDAESCDLLPSESPLGVHHQCDVRELDLTTYDLLIGHPPCTYLCLSGVRWLYGGKGAVRDEARWAAMVGGARLFRWMLDAPVRRVAVENPIMHGHARREVGRGPTQFVQPWMFGHGETKATGLWLRNLPPLVSSREVEGRVQRIYRLSSGPDRWKERSRTYQGIANAMAVQWGAVCDSECFPVYGASDASLFDSPNGENPPG